MTINTRERAARILFELFEEKKSLSDRLEINTQDLTDQDRAFVAELCYGIARYKISLERIAHTLMHKAFTGKKFFAQLLILIGLYQILYMRVKHFAAVNETLKACDLLGVGKVKGVINAVLRNFLRNKDEIVSKVTKKYYTNHPDWLVAKLKEQYPNWRAIIEANQAKPPMWIRVNQSKISRADYAKKIAHLLAKNDETMIASLIPPSALLLEQAVKIDELFAFGQDLVSVQDAHPQWAAFLLKVQNGETILDACAAPGGKTCHLLELAPKADIYALDLHQNRLDKIKENLDRLGQDAHLICGDATKPQSWNVKNIHFDKILLDVPCSATGVIRRHSDIKWLRTEHDIEQLTRVQEQILDANWQLLKENGLLLYATCSVLKEENEWQIERFLARTPDAQLMPITLNEQSFTMAQLLPSAKGGDGFFYALLTKKSAKN